MTTIRLIASPAFVSLCGQKVHIDIHFLLAQKLTDPLLTVLRESQHAASSQTVQHIMIGGCLDAFGFADTNTKQIIIMNRKGANDLACHLSRYANLAAALNGEETALAKYCDSLRAIGYQWEVVNPKTHTGYWHNNGKEKTAIGDYQDSTIQAYNAFIVQRLN